MSILRLPRVHMPRHPLCTSLPFKNISISFPRRAAPSKWMYPEIPIVAILPLSSDSLDATAVLPNIAIHRMAVMMRTMEFAICVLCVINDGKHICNDSIKFATDANSAMIEAGRKQPPSLQKLGSIYRICPVCLLSFGAVEVCTYTSDLTSSTKLGILMSRRYHKLNRDLAVVALDTIFEMSIQVLTGRVSPLRHDCHWSRFDSI
jgi:hypothetical protein